GRYRPAWSRRADARRLVAAVHRAVRARLARPRTLPRSATRGAPAPGLSDGLASFLDWGAARSPGLASSLIRSLIFIPCFQRPPTSVGLSARSAPRVESEAEQRAQNSDG